MEKQAYYICDGEGCGRKWNGEEGIAFSIDEDTKIFCSKPCFFRHIAKKFNVEIVKVTK